MRKYNSLQKVMALALTLMLVIGMVPSIALTTNAAAVSNENTVADPGTAYTYETMMGTDSDGNRYAGRVWVDKSVYTDGDTAVLNTSGAAGSSFEVDLDETNGENFQVIFSALGSSVSTNTTTSSTGPMDVVIILDNSSSMGRYTNTATKYTRLESVTDASNTLISKILESGNNRLAVVTYSTDATTILPLNYYDANDKVLSVSIRNKPTADGNGGVAVSDGDGKMTASATIKGTTTTAGETNTGYQRGTNLQSGINAGMGILANASDTSGRTPVVIVMTDGVADTAATRNWYNPSSYTQPSDNTLTADVALSTLLNAAYMKASIEDNYGKAANVYGVGVDVGDYADAAVVMNPAVNFSASSSSSVARSAYTLYQRWVSSTSTVTNGNWQYAQVPSGDVTKADVQANINYVDTYYDVSSADLESVFDEIYQELSSGAFNPITSTNNGATGVEETPLIYVDDIGKYMEVKDIQAITLFGNSYDVINNGDGNYTVETATGVNPTTNESWNTAEDITIQVLETADGTQQLCVRIDQAILPILLDQVAVNEVGDTKTVTLNTFTYDPLRVYYTVGIDSDILLDNGEIDISAIDSDYAYIDGNTVTFYSNAFGELNTTNTDGDAYVDEGDAHVGFVPSHENRYYYHQANQEIFIKATMADGSEIHWEEGEYGVLWEEGKYKLTVMTYDDYNKVADDTEVYTYVTFIRPTGSGNAAEEVTYLVYTTWGDLKSSVGFYDSVNETFLNEGAAIDANAVEAYKAANAVTDSQLYAVLGLGSRRVSRLHNMFETKTDNATGTAELSYAPEYNDEAHEADDIHEHSEVVVWLGNNGKLTVSVDTGIALTKAVTEAIGNANDTYELTVTIPAGVTATPVVKDADGSTVTSSYANNVLTVPVKAGQTVYITGIPAGTECTIGENIKGDYYIASQTETVTVPTLAEVIAGTADQFAAAAVTNAPKGYGDLTIVKDIYGVPQNMSEAMAAAMAGKEFTFAVNLGAAFKNESFAVDVSNAPQTTGVVDGKITADANGVITVVLRDNESITILDIPEGTEYTVTETNIPDGYIATVVSGGGTQTGTIQKDGDHEAHFINSYDPTAVSVPIDFTINKEVVGSTYNDAESFTFQVQMLGSDDEYVNVNDPIVIANGGTMTTTFTRTREFTQIGTYHFRIIEVEGTTTGMTYSAVKARFKVVVTDENADGVLEAEVISEGNATVSDNDVSATFTNTYKVGSTHVDIDLYKDLVNNTGVEISKTGFRFGLYKVENGVESQTPTYTVNSGELGNATFRIPVTDVSQDGETYILKEIVPAEKIPGMTYDTQEYTIVLHVTDNNGQLEATYTITPEVTDAPTGVEATFQNTYALTKTQYTISATKTLTGKTLEKDEFTFVLHQTGSSFDHDVSTIQDTKKNAAKGTVTFDEIEYTKAGTYYYAVVEQAGVNPGMTYDTTHYHVTVTVGIDPDDATRLKVTHVAINKIGTNSDTSGNMVFVNTYQAAPTEYAIEGIKLLEGRALKSNEFEFALYEGETLIETVKNHADGSFKFSAISYDQAGEYTYTIREVSGNLPGVTYAEGEITVVVTVTDNGDGTMTATADKTKDDIKFTNTYKAEPDSVTIEGVKYLVDSSAAAGYVTAEAGQFTFALYETDHTFDTSGKTPVTTTNGENGKFAFTIEYETTGTHFYVLEEVANVSHMLNDTSKYYFRVTVSDVSAGKLVAKLEDLNDSNDNSFTNVPFDEIVQKDVFLAGDITTSIDGKTVAVGETLTYTITYVNYTGAEATATIHDWIPEYTTYVEGSASEGGVYADGGITWIKTVAAGGSVSVSFQVKVDEPGVTVTNEALVHDGTNLYTTNEVTNETVEEIVEKDVAYAAAPDVSIDGETVIPGQELVYTITYTNGTDNAAAVTITDTLPEHTTYVEASADNGGVYADGVITWNVNVPAHKSITVSFKVTVDAAGGETLTNQATVKKGGNTYSSNEVTNTIPEDMTASIYIQKNVVNKTEGAEIGPDGFEFILNLDGEKQSVTSGETGKAGFQLTFGAEDIGKTFAYKVTEKKGKVSGVTYDDTEYTVTIEVAQNADGSLKTIINGKDTNGIELEFTNTYAKPATPITGDSFQLFLLIGLLAVSGAGIAFLLLFKKRSKGGKYAR